MESLQREKTSLTERVSLLRYCYTAECAKVNVVTPYSLDSFSSQHRGQVKTLDVVFVTLSQCYLLVIGLNDSIDQELMYVDNCRSISIIKVCTNIAPHPNREY